MGGLAKPFLELSGEPILMRALRPFLEHPGVREVVVSLPTADAESPPRWLIEADQRIRVVAGGETRRDSVWAGLQVLSNTLDVAVVHDGARPLVSRDVVDRCIHLAGRGVGGVAGVRAIDTIKEVDGDLRVLATPDRSRLWHAQTPQAFPLAVIMDAYRRAWSRPKAYTSMLNWYRALVQRPLAPPSDAAIAVPTLLIWGAQDRYLGREMAQPSIDLCDDGRLVLIEEATHWVQHEEAERVNKLMDEFLRGDSTS